MVKLRFLILVVVATTSLHGQTKRLRDYRVSIGIVPPGKTNSITDVDGVKVGHTTLIIGDSP